MQFCKLEVFFAGKLSDFQLPIELPKLVAVLVDVGLLHFVDPCFLLDIGTSYLQLW